MTWYNDSDPFVCQWLRNLIEAGELPPGDVDERPIQEVTADDLRGYDRCHFFAGIGGWELALQLAGWERPVWTGSCPCQPFSVAGKGAGEADERHLWPAFHRLIAECRPATVFGEQVASPGGLQWLAGVRTDLEGSGYAVGAADLPAASVGAPHIRQRLWWVANAGRGRVQPDGDAGVFRGAAGEAQGERNQRERCGSTVGDSGADGRLADATISGRRQGSADANRLHGGVRAPANGTRPEHGGGDSRVGDATGGDERRERQSGAGGGRQGAAGGSGARVADAERNGRQQGTEAVCGRQSKPANGSGAARGLGDAIGEGSQVGSGTGPRRQDGGDPWAATVTTDCYDGRTRRVGAGIRPLAHGVPGRVGKLRGLGNAIVPQVAAVFIAAFMDCR